jgi:hypothetical protein
VPKLEETPSPPPPSSVGVPALLPLKVLLVTVAVASL